MAELEMGLTVEEPVVKLDNRSFQRVSHGRLERILVECIGPDSIRTFGGEFIQCVLREGFDDSGLSL